MMAQITIGGVTRIHSSQQAMAAIMPFRSRSSLMMRPSGPQGRRIGGNGSPALCVRSPPISGARPSSGRSVISLPRPAPRSTRRDGSANGWRLSAKQASAEAAVEASAGPAMAALLSAKEAVTYFVSLLANDAGKDPNNPLWMVGAAKLAFFGFLLMAYRVLQPQLDRYVERMQESQEQDSANGGMGESQKTTRGYMLALTKAIQTSTKSLVPIMIGLVCVSNLSDFIEDILYVKSEHLSVYGASALKKAAQALTSADLILEKATSLLAVAVGVQFAVSLKDQVVAEFMRARAAIDTACRVVSQSVVTLSQYSTKVIYAIGAVVGLAVLGIDIRPLAAIGGIGGLAVGLGAQTLVESLLSGIQLIISNPFQAGDVVELKGTETDDTILIGRVEKLAPFRTTFVPLTDKRVPITIPNSLIVGMQISNRSRISEPESGDLLQDFKETRKLHMEMSVGMNMENGLAENVPMVSESIETALFNMSETAPSVPITVEWQNISSGTASFEVVTFLDTVPGQYEKAKTKALCVIEQELKQIGCTIEEVATIV